MQQHGIDILHIVGKQERGRNGLALGQFGPVFAVKVPAPAKGLAPFIEQHTILLAQSAVEKLHPAVGIALPAIPRCEEMFAVDLMGRHGEPRGPLFKLRGQPPLIRALPGKAAGLVVDNLGIEQGRQVRPVPGFIQGEIADSVTRLGEGRGEGAHGGEKGQHLLTMVAAVVGLLAQLRQQIADVGIRGTKPAVTGVELIAED